MNNVSFFNKQNRERAGERKRIIYQLLQKKNWRIIEDVECFLYIFDRMPRQMKVVVDLKINGDTNKIIADKLEIGENQVRAQISRAKKRLLIALT